MLLLVAVDDSAAAEPPDKAVPQTALAKLAASMQPGQWAELKTNDLAIPSTSWSSSAAATTARDT